MMNNQSEIFSEGRRLAILVAASLFVLTAARFAFVFIDAPGAWGINALAFLPSEIGIVLTLIALGFIVWSMRQPGEAAGAKKWNFDPFGLPARVVVPIVAGLLFFLIHIPTALLGDAGLFEGDLYRHVALGQPVPLYREPLTMLIEGGLAAMFSKLMVTEYHIMAYRMTGALSGLVFVAAAQRIAMLIRGGQAVRVLSFVLLVSCGGVLLFFGYVENYAPQYALVLWYVLLVLQMFRKRTSPVWPGIVLAACCLFHLQNVLLIPSYIVALGMGRALKNHRGEQFGAGVYKYMMIAAPVLLLIYALLQWKPVAPLETGDNPFIPFMTVGGMSYTLLSPMHLADIVSEHLLLAPVTIVLLVIALWIARRSIRWVTPEMTFCLVAAMALEAFLIGGNLGLGMARDWDVLATLGPVLTMILIVALEDIEKRAAMHSRLLIAVGVVAVVGAVGWVAVNVDGDGEVARYRSLLGYYRPAVTPSVTRYGYENLRKLYQTADDWKMESQTAATMLEVLPWHIDLSNAMAIAEQHVADAGAAAGEPLAQMLRQLVHSASDSALLSETAGNEGNLRISVHHSGDPANLADLIEFSAIDLCDYIHTWSLQDGEAFADTVIQLHPAIPLGYELKGWLCFIEKRQDVGKEYLDMAMMRDSLRARPRIVLGSDYLSRGIVDSARIYGRRAMQLDAGCLDAMRLLYSSIRKDHLLASDTPDLDALVHGTQLRLSQVKERHIKQNEIADIKAMQHNIIAVRRAAQTSPAQ